MELVYHLGVPDFFPVPLLTHPRQGVSQPMLNWRVLPTDPAQALSNHGVR